MPKKGGVATAQEKVFTREMAKTGNPVYAAAIAGYKHPEPRAYENLRKPALQAEIIKHQQQILIGELLPASTLVLAKMLDMETPGVPWSARATAAKIVRAEVAGMVDGKGAKDFSDMTAEEIHTAIEDARRQLAERSKPVLDHVDDAPEAGAFE